MKNDTLIFRKPCKNDIAEITDFKKEFEEHKSGMDGTWTLFRRNADEWLQDIAEIENRSRPDIIPSLQYGLFSESGRLLGLIQIRLILKGYLVNFGGHIGYCVRPSERRKGYAKTMLENALDICRSEELDKVLITCLKDNIGSEKTILSCGGVYEKTVYDDVNYKDNIKRFWIAL